jgi:hypothetical protein
VGLFLKMNIDQMIDEAITDTIKVTTAIVSTNIALEFVEGWGKVITWIIGVVYVSLKIIQIVRELYGKDKSGKKM